MRVFIGSPQLFVCLSVRSTVGLILCRAMNVRVSASLVLHDAIRPLFVQNTVSALAASEGRRSSELKWGSVPACHPSWADRFQRRTWSHHPA